jgi:hypothetical protein
VTVADSALRRIEPVELRPDLVLSRGEDGPWVLVEVQRDVDPVKQRKWLLAAAMLYDARSVMGDIVVLTSRASVAEWARTVAQDVGALGKRVGLVPVVVPLTGEVAERLLDEAHPELTFFAAFAMHERRGPAARQVVSRALQLSDLLPEALQQAQLRAIFSVLSEPMLAWLEEVAIQPDSELESDALRAWMQRIEARGDARGEAQALLTVLAARGIAVDDQTRELVLACTDTATLGRWIARAATASALSEVFGGD